jgi:hypothetical protein
MRTRLYHFNFQRALFGAASSLQQLGWPDWHIELFVVKALKSDRHPSVRAFESQLRPSFEQLLVHPSAVWHMDGRSIQRSFHRTY